MGYFEIKRDYLNPNNMKHKRKKRKQKQEELTPAAKILLSLFALIDLVPRPLESKSRYVRRLINGQSDFKAYYKIMMGLEKRGIIKIFKDKNGKHIQLTPKGRIEVFLEKAKIVEHGSWDGKFRMAVFDIPEDARSERNKLRKLLKINGYKKLQQSVFINPYPLNEEGIKYLQETGLIKYIRIFRIDKADDEESLLKMFKLTPVNKN